MLLLLKVTITTASHEQMAKANVRVVAKAMWQMIYLPYVQRSLEEAWLKLQMKLNFVKEKYVKNFAMECKDPTAHYQSVTLNFKSL